MLYIACLFFRQWCNIFLQWLRQLNAPPTSVSLFACLLFIRRMFLFATCVQTDYCFLVNLLNWVSWSLILVWYFTSCVYYYRCNYHLQVFHGHICIWKKYTVYKVWIIIYVLPYFFYYSTLAFLLCWFILICHWVTVLSLLITLELLWQVNFPSEGSLNLILKVCRSTQVKSMWTASKQTKWLFLDLMVAVGPQLTSWSNCVLRLFRWCS